MASGMVGRCESQSEEVLQSISPTGGSYSTRIGSPSTTNDGKYGECDTQITTPTSLDIDTWLFGPTVQRRKDELDDYLSQAVLDFPSKEEREAFDIMEYWRGHLRVWPTLSRMFFDLASIPSMSVEPERVFSG